MTDEPRTWHLERSTPTRADAESLFVASAELPEATIGDRVSIAGHEHGDQRTGTVVELAHHDDEPFLRVQLDE